MSVFTSPGRTGRTSPARWLAWLLTLGLFACDSSVPPAPPLRQIRPKGNSLFLEVKSVEGDVVPSAQVLMPTGQRQKTSQDGKVLLQELPKGPQLLHVGAEGFFETIVAFDMAEGVQAGARLKLFPLGAPIKTFDASDGMLESVSGIELEVPRGAFYDENNNPIQGQVEVFMSTLDLDGDELRVAPGVLEGVIGPDGTPVPLESLGIVSLEFRSSGQVIHHARGIGVRGSVPRSVRASTMKSGMQLPVWKPEGAGWTPTGDTARIVASTTRPGELDWKVEMVSVPEVFNIALPYWWRSEHADPTNPLKPTEPAWVETACLEVRVADDAQQPVAGLEVEARGTEYSGIRRVLTDTSGRALLQVMRNRKLEVVIGDRPPEDVTVLNAGTCTSGEGAAPMVISRTVPTRLCTAGEARDCASGVTRGICQPARQTCDVDGLSWSACGGEVGPLPRELCDNSLDDDCDGDVNEDCATVCPEGATEPCYTGPEGTAGVGACRAGTRSCLPGGSGWSVECVGQRLPEEEVPSRPEDEDCDGVVGQCRPWMVEACAYTGPAGTAGQGRCRAGTRTCNALGTDWEACTGEVRPHPEELCTTPEDDDCDGEVTVCACAPNTTEPCYSGPQGTRNVGACRAGTQTCNAEGTDWISTCVGEVRPQPDTCFNNIDDDCNNVAPVCAWSQGAVMNTARFRHQAVLLRNGRVLVVGGTSDGNTRLSGTEEYNPASETWPADAVSTMSAAREEFGMVVLPDGRVLVAGGYNGGTALSTAELYNPDTRTWSLTGSMTTARQKHTMTLLSDGKVLVAGGVASDDLASAEVYDPATGAWSTTGTMTTARKKHTMTRLDDGRVLVTGGRIGGNGASDPFSSLTSAEVYNPATGTWTSTDPMGTSRAYHSATLLSDGRVLIAGGENGGRGSVTFHSSAEVYDPASGTWVDPTQMNSTRTNNTHAVTRVGNGRVMVVGGYDGIHTAEVYDPVARSWQLTSNLNTPRGELAAVLLNNGQVLICGGLQYPNAHSSTELFSP